MDQLTPQEAEILRLWGVIRKLRTQRMTDREEEVLGTVLDRLQRITPKYNHEASVMRKDLLRRIDPETLEQELILLAAVAIRELQILKGVQ